MRFFLDNDVPVSVGTMLRRNGHLCWTANGLQHAGDLREVPLDEPEVPAGDAVAAAMASVSVKSSADRGRPGAAQWRCRTKGEFAG